MIYTHGWQRSRINAKIHSGIINFCRVNYPKENVTNNNLGI